MLQTRMPDCVRTAGCQKRNNEPYAARNKAGLRKSKTRIGIVVWTIRADRESEGLSLELDPRTFCIRSRIRTVAWYISETVKGPSGMPSVQSPLFGPVLWKKFAFQRGMAAANKEMATRLASRLATCNIVIKRRRKR